MKAKLCFIKKEYFENHKLIKVLDVGNTNKQSRRSHLCLQISSDNNHYYIPLRNNLGKDIRVFGRIGHLVPSKIRPNAGLDYRYTLVINDQKYIEYTIEQRIPNSQIRIIENDYEKIIQEFNQYVSGFIKTYKKNRLKYSALYRESSLINFVEELIR